MRILYVLQGDYGHGHGWEDLTASYDRSEMVEEQQTYRAESPEGRYRIDPRAEESDR